MSGKIIMGKGRMTGKDIIVERDGNEWTCTCRGFEHTGTCKHVYQAQAEHEVCRAEHLWGTQQDR